MILESTRLVGAEQRRDEVASPTNASQARRGAEPATTNVKRSYTRVVNDIAEGTSKDRPEQTRSTESAKGFSLWENPDFGFGDFLDIVNPLQHIPIVATIYRNLTGDRIGMAPRVIGGALWGRIGGLVSGVINSVVDWFTGKDIGDHIYSALWRAPDTSPKHLVGARPVDETLKMSEISATEPTDTMVPESVSVADHQFSTKVATVNEQDDLTLNLAAQDEPRHVVSRHLHHLPYRRNDELSEAFSSAGKLNFNA